MKNRSWIFFAVLFGTYALDMLVKAWARGAMPEGGSLHGLPWPGIFEFKLTYNEGVAFGLFQGSGRFLAPVAIAIAIGAGWYAVKHPKEGTITQVAMGLLASGALGNLYDRMFLGRVTDMFWIRLIDFPVFNIADTCITFATILLIVIWWRDAMRPKPVLVEESSAAEVLAERPEPAPEIQ
ncbi:MAG: signal peptidase II [Fimbriimonas sp.]